MYVLVCEIFVFMAIYLCIHVFDYMILCILYKCTHIGMFVHMCMCVYICRYVYICYAMMVLYVCTRVILTYEHERSYHVNCTRSRPIPEVKRRRVQPVVRCVSTCEAWILFVLLMPLTPILHTPTYPTPHEQIRD